MMTTTSYLQSVVDEFVDSRDWHHHHTERNLAESIAIESAELLKEFQWNNEFNNPMNHDNIKDELADVMIYCLALANRLDVDACDIIIGKIDKNAAKYPIKG